MSVSAASAREERTTRSWTPSVSAASAARNGRMPRRRDAETKTYDELAA
jgi:hypothetical protein